MGQTEVVQGGNSLGSCAKCKKSPISTYTNPRVDLGAKKGSAVRSKL